MRIDSSGNLLVNGTNATAKLVVDGAANSYATRFNSSTTTGQAFGARIRAGTNSSDYALLVENTSASSMLTVRGDGNVGIAESDPQGLLHVDGFDYSYFSSNVGSATLDNQQGLAIGWNKSAGAGETVLIANQGAGSAGGMAFATNTSAGSYNERMRIDASGNVGLNTSSPSTYDSRANNLVVGDSGDAGVTIFSGSTSNARLQFAPSGATGLDNGLIDYDNNNDSMSFATGGSERMRLDASGNLLVGRTSVGTTGTGHSIRGGDSAIFARAGGEVAIFSRSDSDGEILRFDGNGSAGVGSIGAFSSRMYIGTGDTGLQFLSSADNIIPIDPSGPSNRDAAIDLGASGVRFKDLYLSGNATHGTTPSSSAAGVFTEAVGRATYSRGSGVGGFGHLSFINGNGAVGSVVTSGSATAYNTSSDYRLKENVVAMTGATERLKQLKPSRFNFIADAHTTVDGFLAHEVQDIVPEAIAGEKDAMIDEEYEVTPAVLDDDGNVITEAVMGTRSVPDYQGIDQSKLVPLLVATIQELEARITALETN